MRQQNFRRQTLALGLAWYLARNSLPDYNASYQLAGPAGSIEIVRDNYAIPHIFAANDQMAYGARLALYRRNMRVPEEISLVGYDDLPKSTYSMPPLTTVRQPVYEMGKLAAQAMLKLIAGEAVELSAPPLEFVVRESTRRIRR